MDSPAEILAIRRQWGDAKPDRRVHPSDKAEVPEYPTEDSLAACTKRPDGLYKCLHAEGSHHKCCSEGLTEKNKKHAIGKQIRAWKTKVEEMVLKGELHVAHKTWADWNKKSKGEYGGEVGRWDGLLGLLGGLLGRKGGGQGLGTPSPRPVAAPASRSPVAPAHQTPIKNVRQAVPQGHGPQPFVPSASPTQQMSPLQQTTPAHATSRQFQHQSPPQRPSQQPVNTGSIASSPAQHVSPPQSQAQPTFTNSPTRAFATSATSRSPASSAKHGYGSPDFAYAGPYSNVSPRQHGPAGAFSQRRSQEEAVIASGAVPVVAQQVVQYASTSCKTLSPVASAQSNCPSNGHTTPQSTNRKREQRPQQQQAPPQPKNARQQQADVQLPPSGATANHAARTCPVPTHMTTTPSTAPQRTSASTLTPNMSSTTHTLWPEKSSKLAASSPAKAEPAVDYRPVAMRMLQQQFRDHKPIVLGGVKITRDDVNSNMSGCVGRLAMALRAEAEEVARRGIEEAARREVEDAARKKAEETAQSTSKGASHNAAGDAEEHTTDPVSNEGHELDYLFSSTPIDPADSHPIDFGNPNDYLFSSSPDSPNDNKWRPEFMPDLPPNFGKMDLIGMTQRAFAEEPSHSPSQPGEQPEPEPEEDTLADLSYPEAWFIEDVEDFVTSGPLPEWMTRPTTEFTLENMQVDGFDGDLGMPGDPEEWLQATRVWREEKRAGAR